MGCLKRLGCLVLLAGAAAIAWVTQDSWLPARFQPRSTAAGTATWEPLTDVGAARTRAALAKLSEPSGPVFQTLSGADVASYVFRELALELPRSTDSIRTLVSGDRISMRAVVKLSDLGDSGALSSLGMLGDHAPVEFTGTIKLVHPGLGEFQMDDVKVRGLSLPHGMISTLIRRFDRATRPSGVDPDALPLPLPSYVGDIRVANGKITLYKNVR
ncbi:MAG TPA: hypothetical protein VH277_06060 [Gemmatimonadaceae bacterium]|jgi:hypothetical protein|nr:hypothetical protein [Gemmatimonadaceae bacterium]